MSEEQLSAFLAKLKDDTGLQEKLQGAADFDAAVAIAKEAGFDVSKADWLRHQATQPLELNDEELERVSGGFDGFAKIHPGHLGAQTKTYVDSDAYCTPC
jgi:predicted ribosomally synthesized peptide with nif11-like leader